MNSPNFRINIELAGAYKVGYVPTGDFEVDLRRIQAPDQAFSQELHALRLQTKADLVTLLVEGRQYCGMAYRPDLPITSANRDLGFSVVNRNCALSNLSLAHELGHNFGMRHDRITEKTSNGGYNYGYIDVLLGAISIMSYQTACGDISCTRYPFYSSPKIMLSGRPFGTPLADPSAMYNSEVLCDGARAIADYLL